MPETDFLPTEHAKLRDALERAVKSDPGYSDAWACSMLYSTSTSIASTSTRGQIRWIALWKRRGGRLPWTLPANRAHHALAQVYFFRHELDAFFAEAERALALNPNDAGLLGVLGASSSYAGDERGIAFVRKAMKLDPFHPTWFHFPIAGYHFERGEYEEALAAARKIDFPGFFVPQSYLAAIYAELGRQSEARSAVEELLRLCPGFNTEKHIERVRKMNFSTTEFRPLGRSIAQGRATGVNGDLTLFPDSGHPGYWEEYPGGRRVVRPTRRSSGLRWWAGPIGPDAGGPVARVRPSAQSIWNWVRQAERDGGV